MPILKAAWTVHPDSFALALTISSRLIRDSGMGTIETVGWGRTAVALRPNNPLSHYYLALALGRGLRDNAHAAEELRRPIQLAPRFAKAYGQLAMILRGDMNAEALSSARKAIELDNKSLYGHVVILLELMAKKEYIEAARVYQRIAALRPEDWLLEDSFEYGYMEGIMSETIDTIQVALIRTGRPFEAYRLVGHSDPRIHGTIGGYQNDWGYNSSCAAVLAGTGQGVDAPPPADRPAIRKQALEWLTSSFDGWKKHAMALPILGASSAGLSSAGLMGSPLGHGPLLAVCALSPQNPNLAARPFTSCEAVHKRMSEWLSDPDLAGVRDDQWLAKLPGDEREQWRKLWADVRFLRDHTAPAKATPLPVGK